MRNEKNKEAFIADISLHNIYTARHATKKKKQVVLTALAAFVTFITVYMLILPAITMDISAAAKCGLTAHTHTDDCYNEYGVLTCDVPEHEHDMTCFIEGYTKEMYSCGYDYEHVHNDSCYKNGVLICSLQEHTHSDTCEKTEAPAAAGTLGLSANGGDDWEISKTIDYLGDNDGIIDDVNPDTELDDYGIEGLDELYRLYLSFEYEEKYPPTDLLCVIDESGSMAYAPDGSTATDTNPSKATLLETVVNGPDGYIQKFLASNPDNRIAFVQFSSDVNSYQDFTRDASDIKIAAKGATNMSAALAKADELLTNDTQDKRKVMIFLGDGQATYAYEDGGLHTGEESRVGLGTDFYYSAMYRANGLLNALYQLDTGTYILSEQTGVMNALNTSFSDPVLLTNDKEAVGYDFKNCITDTIPGVTIDYDNDLLYIDQTQISSIYTTFYNYYYSNYVYYYNNYNEYYFNYYGSRGLNYLINNGILKSQANWGQIDLFELTESAYDQFYYNNPEVITHVIGFGSDVQGEFTDLNGVVRQRDEVFHYIAEMSDGDYYSVDNMEELLDALSRYTEIKNINLTDYLSDYVDFYDESELRFTCVEGSGKETVLYENGALTPEGEKVIDNIEIDTVNNKFSVQMTESYHYNRTAKYIASFSIEVNQYAKDEYEYKGYDRIGDAGTDYNNNETSSGKNGFYSNDEATVTYNKLGKTETKTLTYSKPVVQVNERLTASLPSTGGTGTVVFIAVGIIIMVITAVLLITYIRSKRGER